jgi:ABC-type glycerol-3-phosphate transport system substrate-binding protein
MPWRVWYEAELERRLAAATPTPAVTPAPFVVATPVPKIAQPNATSINFSSAGIPFDQLQSLVQRFSAQRPDIVVQPSPPARGGTLVALARNSDCFISFQAPQSVDEPALHALQPLIDADAAFRQADDPPAVLARLRPNGRLLGLPLQLGVPTLHFNSSLLDQAGMSAPTADWSLDAFRAAAQRATGGSGPAQPGRLA